MEPLIQLGDCLVDLEIHEVRRGATRTHLSANEVALLRYLAEQGGKPVSRERLHQDVFGYAPQVVSRACDFAVHRLRKKIERDASAPVHLLTVAGVGFRLVIDPVPAQQAAVQTGRHNLPAETTSFLGRQEELGAVEALLAGEARQVSLVGPAGVGKTRLALRAAAGATQRGVSVCLVELEHARDLAAVCSEVATALGLEPLSSGRSVEQLGAALMARGPTLLVLDNLEQVVDDAATACAAWLRGAPELQVLATSRERLRTPGEHVLTVAPLGPEAGRALFVERARLARPDFDPGEEEHDAVDRLVERLDGLPLAIELAAARSGLLEPRQILARFEEQGELGRAPRGVPPRQSTLEQAIAWSWELLSEPERRVLSELTVFPVGFALQDAEAVVQPAPSGPTVIELVQALLEKSLLRALPGEGRRFGLLGAVRAFAAERGGGRLAVRVRHARWVQARACRPVHEQLLGPRGEALEGLLAVDDDLRAAIDSLAELGDQPVLLAELVIAARTTWHRSNATQGYLDRVHRALEGDLPPEVRARLHLVEVNVRLWDGHGTPGSAPNWSTIVGLVRHDPWLQAFARLAQGTWLSAESRFDEALQALDQASEHLAGLRPGPLHARVVAQRANIAGLGGQLTEARTLTWRALDLYERLGAPEEQPAALFNLALAEGRLGHREEQVGLARRALLRAREVGERRIERRALFTLAAAEAELGMIEQAGRHAADGLALCVKAHDVLMAHHTVLVLVELDFVRGELDEVRRHLRLARERFALPYLPWTEARIAGWAALAEWADWGSPALWVQGLEAAAAEVRAEMPHAGAFLDGKVLAARAYLPEATLDALAASFDRLQDEARAANRPDQLRGLALDRAHLQLAAALRGGDVATTLRGVERILQEDRDGPWAPGGLDAACSRVVLAGVIAELEERGDTRAPRAFEGEAG